MAILPDNVLKCMSAHDREALGSPTAEEIISTTHVASEREVQRLILEYLRLRGITGFRARMDRKTTIAAGHPDIWFCLPSGQACALEVKVSGNSLSADQARTLERMRQEGWYTAVVHSLAEAVSTLEHWTHVTSIRTENTTRHTDA